MKAFVLLSLSVRLFPTAHGFGLGLILIKAEEFLRLIGYG